ncbi:uncharacterized protein LOC8085871 isoform X1 [Sorghum bicolor]|uniref:uncharacterized protein LOC8085871 isoform X1 n=1 Tax=Sorghum bicolor TaxID=4558 RepID=UPI000B423690|nr:uncharacterized protein LOC8085871 isoform X1 [Sorghum bicolor]|eukprot:XP_021319785.1 uncharacterized protein LOC8085871 isoform X1 [Sorghum bicolor]
MITRLATTSYYHGLYHTSPVIQLEQSRDLEISEISVPSAKQSRTGLGRGRRSHPACSTTPYLSGSTRLQPPPPPPTPGDQTFVVSISPATSTHQLVTRLADAIGTGTRDQNSDALVEELTSQFARCQQLLNSISGTISSKSTTVEGQRQSLDETRQLLDQRKELITKYRSSVEDLLKGDKR